MSYWWGSPSTPPPPTSPTPPAPTVPSEPAPPPNMTTPIVPALSMTATPEMNRNIMNEAIAAFNAHGGRMWLPAGRFPIRAPLATLRGAGLIEGSGAFSSQSSGTVLAVTGSGQLWTTERPVWFKYFLVDGGDAGIVFEGVNGGGIEGMVLQQQRISILLHESNQYTLRDSSLTSYTETGVLINGTGPGQDGGDATIDNLVHVGAAGSKALRWTGMGGLKYVNNKILLQGMSAEAALDFDAEDGVRTGDLILCGNSIEGSYSYGVRFQARGTGAYANVQCQNNQLTGMTWRHMTFESAEIGIFNVGGNIYSGGSSPVLLDILAAVDGYVGGNTFGGNGQQPDAIVIGPSAIRVTVGPNHYGAGIGREVVRL